MDQVATDLYYFFKTSDAHRQDYKMVENITKITTHYMKNHVESRSLSIGHSPLQVLEQMENVSEYFFEGDTEEKGI